MFYCDVGVLWHDGNELLPGVFQSLEHLYHTLKKKLIFVSNNSIRSRDMYVQLFHSLGLDFVDRSHVFGSSYAVAVYLKNIAKMDTSKEKSKIFIVGQEGLEMELKEVGYHVIHASVNFIMHALAPCITGKMLGSGFEKYGPGYTKRNSEALRGSGQCYGHYAHAIRYGYRLRPW